MRNILNKIKIDNTTYLLILLALLSGYIKNIFIILIIVLIHELGHVFFFLLFKIDIVSVVIYPFGGVTSVNKRIHERIYKDILISLGGIIFQLILFIIFYLLYRNNLIVRSTYNIFNTYNKSVLLFNLLPIIPLDGSKFLFSLLSKYLSFKISNILSIIIGIISLIVFIIYISISGLNDLVIVIFLCIKLIEVIKNYKYIMNKFYLERIIYNNYYDGIVSNSSVDKMKLDKYYYFYDGRRYVNEREYIKGLKNSYK